MLLRRYARERGAVNAVPPAHQETEVDTETEVDAAPKTEEVKKPKRRGAKKEEG